MSEYCPSVKISKDFFVQRDRLQSALTSGVFIVECAKKSGTLHAVATAINLKKIVFVWNPLKKEKIKDINLISGNLALINKEFNTLNNSNFKKLKKSDINIIEIKEVSDFIEIIHNTTSKIGEYYTLF